MDNAPNPNPKAVQLVSELCEATFEMRAEYAPTMGAVTKLLSRESANVGTLAALSMGFVTALASQLSLSVGTPIRVEEVLMGLLMSRGSVDLRGVSVPKGKEVHVVLADEGTVQADGPREPS